MEILVRLGVMPAVRARRVHNWTFAVDKPAQMYDLIHLVQKWLEPERSTPAQILEKVVVDHFSRTLPPKLQRWVGQGDLQTAEQLVNLVERFSATEDYLRDAPTAQATSKTTKPLKAMGKRVPAGVEWFGKMNDTALHVFILLGLSSNPHIQMILFVIFFIMYLVTLCANSLIILATITDANLHTPMYFFLTNLSFLDLFFSSSVILRMLRDLLAAEKTILFSQCFAQMYVSLGLGTTECILLAVLAYDRYVAICYPLHYKTVISQDVCIKIASGTWICGFTFTNIPLALSWRVDFCGHNIINHFFCEAPELLAIGCGNVSTVELVIFIIGVKLLILPICFIIMTYINIIRAIFKISSSVGRKRTFSTCSSHIIVVVMFYGSVLSTYMKPRSSSSPDKDKFFAVFYNIVTPMVNPLVYTLRNKEVKSALKKILMGVTCSWPTSPGCMRGKKLAKCRTGCLKGTEDFTAQVRDLGGGAVPSWTEKKTRWCSPTESA
ncbi:olfactory receptor 2D2-like [Gastrophryne carolinensis]